MNLFTKQKLADLENESLMVSVEAGGRRGEC